MSKELLPRRGKPIPCRNDELKLSVAITLFDRALDLVSIEIDTCHASSK